MSGSMSSSVQPGDGLTQGMINQFQHTQDVDESIYLGLQIAGGHILLPLLVLTVVFSSRVKKHPVFLNFCLSWIFSSVIYSLLVYRGRSRDDNLSLSPSYDECLIQAALINGVQALTVCATLSFVFHFWTTIRSILRADNITTEERWSLTYISLLIGIPFAFFAAFTLFSVIVGNQFALEDGNGSPVSGSNLSVPSVFYCVIILNGNFTNTIAPGMKIVRAVYIFSAVVSLITLCVEVDIARRLYLRWEYLGKMKGVGKAGALLLFFRVALFSVYRVLSLCLTLAVVLNPDELLLAGLASSALYNGVIDFVQAAIPLVAFIAFATDRDVLNVWCFWRRKRELLSTSATDSKQTEDSFDTKSV